MLKSTFLRDSTSGLIGTVSIPWRQRSSQVKEPDCRLAGLLAGPSFAFE